MVAPRDEGKTGGGRSPASIIVQRRIEWPDTDASGMYHNTAAFRFTEVAETALLERLGFVHEIYGRHPRAHLVCRLLLEKKKSTAGRRSGRLCTFVLSAS